MTGEPWQVRVHWKPEPGVTCPEFTTYAADDESQAIDSAVSALDGNRHPWALVKASGAEVRRAGDSGPWRSVASSSTYL